MLPLEEEIESFFLVKLEQLAASGDFSLNNLLPVEILAPKKRLKKFIILISLVKLSLQVSGDFLFNLTHKLFERSDPFNQIVKNYEKRQDEMLVEQRKGLKNNMAYLQRKMGERLQVDSATMVCKQIQQQQWSKTCKRSMTNGKKNSPY
jgi:hypothetical protein